MRETLKRVLSSTGAAVVIAFLVRVVIFYFTFRSLEIGVVRDNLPYGAETGAVAASIAAGHGFSSPLRMVHNTGPTAWFTPIYPLLLAGIFKLFGIFSYKSSLFIRVIDIAFSAFTCWPIEAIGTKAFGKKAGIAAAWAWVALPTAIFFPIIWIWDTALAGLWMALLVAATFRIRGCDQTSSWMGYGVLWAIGALINPSVLSVLPFLALWAIWPLRQHFARAAKLALASGVIFIVCIVPWTIRNYVAFHKFIPLRSNFGLELWLGNNPDVPDTWSPSLHPNDNLDEAKKYARMTEIPYMEEKQREAFAFMRANPTDVARFTFRRFVDNWLGLTDTPVDVWRTGPLNLRIVISVDGIFSLLSLLGALFAYRAKNDAALPFVAVMLVFPAVFYITHTSLRYRFPMDPIMQVLAVYAVAYPLSLFAGRSSARQASPQASTRAGDETLQFPAS